MIVAEQKPIDEVLRFVQGHRRVVVLGCGTCVTVCLSGGEKAVATLSAVMRLSTRLEQVREKTVERQCDAEFFEEIDDLVESSDAIVSMACGAGVQMAARVFPDKPVYPALNTKFMGTNDGAGQWSENCLGCGDCKLGIYGAVCPVARCSKSLMNGPCGGSDRGKCEVDPANIDCGWQLIFDRLTKLGRLDLLSVHAEPRDWSKTHCGRPRTLSREDIAGL